MAQFDAAFTLLLLLFIPIPILGAAFLFVVSTLITPKFVSSCSNIWLQRTI